VTCLHQVLGCLVIGVHWQRRPWHPALSFPSQGSLQRWAWSASTNTTTTPTCNQCCNI